MYYLADIRGSFDGDIHCKLTTNDIKDFFSIYKTINMIEKIYIVRNIALKCNEEFYLYIDRLLNEFNSGKRKDYKSKDIRYGGMDYLLKSITISRLFTENITVNIKEKFGASSIEYNHIKKLLKVDDNELLRLLRNYSFHYSLPISTGSIQYDILKQNYFNIEFYIRKRELFKNGFFREYEVRRINRINKDEKIIFNELVSKWSKLINEIYNYYLKINVELIYNDYKRFNSKYEEIFKLEEVQVYKMNTDGTYDKYFIDKDIYNSFKKYIEL